MKVELKFKNRIAFYYIIVTAILIALVFLSIYTIVNETVISHLNSDLLYEANEIKKSLSYSNGEIIITVPNEWTEMEHGLIEVNPTFIQLIYTNGSNIRKSANLQEQSLKFFSDIKAEKYFNTTLSNEAVRQLQLPLVDKKGNIIAYILVAIPFRESRMVLSNLKLVLILSYPLILLILFLIARFIAGRIILPVNNLISTAEKITSKNLDERINLPKHQDELYRLIQTINNLLDRLRDAILREKQFTSDASHELRTPLSVIRGTLEVLIRRPREISQYEEKIKSCICEVDRMSNLIDQLLLLARYDAGNITPMKSSVDLIEECKEVALRLEPLLKTKNISVYYHIENPDQFQNNPSDYYVKSLLTLDKLQDENSELKSKFEYATHNFPKNFSLKAKVDVAMFDIIVENLLTNAIKYSYEGSRIDIFEYIQEDKIFLSFRDFGVGISKEELQRIFDRFYRIDKSRSSSIEGFGLGLSIVKKFCDLQNIDIKVDSEINIGTIFTLMIPFIDDNK